LVGRKRAARKYFAAEDFVFNPDSGKLTCPADKELSVKDRTFYTANGYHGTVYMAKKTDCGVCELRSQCLRKAATPARTVLKVERRDPQE
ncbi:transposase, partial [Streptomyces sp. P17]|uniref:transposase n=1 Tax=Streptomyces sp. P17 TaxID=3074716 RepID=UPI0028F4000E